MALLAHAELKRLEVVAKSNGLPSRCLVTPHKTGDVNEDGHGNKLDARNDGSPQPFGQALR